MRVVIKMRHQQLRCSDIGGVCYVVTTLRQRTTMLQRQDCVGTLAGRKLERLVFHPYKSRQYAVQTFMLGRRFCVPLYVRHIPRLRMATYTL